MDIFNERYLPLFEQSGLTDAELEREIGLPRSIIYDWKKSRNKGFKKYADKISNYFGVSTDYLLGNETKENSPIIDEAIGLYEKYKRLTPEQQTMVEALMKGFEKK